MSDTIRCDLIPCDIGSDPSCPVSNDGRSMFENLLVQGSSLARHWHAARSRSRFQIKHWREVRTLSCVGRDHVILDQKMVTTEGGTDRGGAVRRPGDPTPPLRPVPACSRRVGPVPARRVDGAPAAGRRRRPIGARRPFVGWRAGPPPWTLRRPPPLLRPRAGARPPRRLCPPVLARSSRTLPRVPGPEGRAVRSRPPKKTDRPRAAAIARPTATRPRPSVAATPARSLRAGKFAWTTGPGTARARDDCTPSRDELARGNSSGETSRSPAPRGCRRGARANGTSSSRTISRCFSAAADAARAGVRGAAALTGARGGAACVGKWALADGELATSFLQLEEEQLLLP